MSKKRVHPLILIFIIAWVLVGAYTFAATIIRPLTWTGWAPHLTGSFYTDDGNPGIIEFGLSPTASWLYNDTTLVSTHLASGANLISDSAGNTLSGYFWIGTIGWVSLENVDFIPTGWAPTDPYSLSWWAWSDYAGWIDFHETGSVIWDPSNTSFSGYAWNDGIGWINMAGGTIASTSSGLIGKVKVLGNLGGEQILDTTYTIKSTSLNGTSMNDMINTIRKNTSYLLRNLPTSQFNTDFSTTNPNTSNQAILFVNTGSSSEYVSLTYGSVGNDVLSKFNNVTNPIQSLIVVGWDIYLDEAVVKNLIWPSGWDDHPRAIIALKNEAWVGGNIYIHGTITRLMTSLVAEWSLYSVSVDTPKKDISLTLNDWIADDALNLPDRQLYIHGSIISHNTIGWSYVDPPVCPFTETNCTSSWAIRYDLNYFRDFQKGKPWASAFRWYKDDPVYDDYSVIIEYDARVLSDPPPWLAPVD